MSETTSPPLDVEIVPLPDPTSEHVALMAVPHGGERGGPPYDFTVDWGDGTYTRAGLLDAEAVEFHHDYAPAEPYRYQRRLPKRRWWNFRARYEEVVVPRPPRSEHNVQVTVLSPSS